MVNAIVCVIDEETVFQKAKSEAVSSFEKEYAFSKLVSCNGNVTAAARKSGLHRSAFQRLMRKYAIRPESVKTAPEAS